MSPQTQRKRSRIAVAHAQGQRHMVAVLLPLLCAIGCAHIDERTAVEHELEAELHRAFVDKAQASVRIAETALPVPSGTERERSGTGPTTQELAGGRAAREVAIARRHEEAAQRLRQAATVACAGLAIEAQVSCPLPARANVVEIPGGVRLIVQTALSPQALRAQLDCAQAQARVDRPGDYLTCPLLGPGAQARVVDRTDQGTTIELTTEYASQVSDLRARVRRYLVGTPGTDPATRAP